VISIIHAPLATELGKLTVRENTLSKAPSDIVGQLQNLEDLYQELLTLRSRVRQAERLNEEHFSIEANPQRSRYLDREKPNHRKRSK
jgi:hypothetical protein